MINVLAEENFDGLLIAKLLSEETANLRAQVKVANGLAASYSAARTILAVNREPVAVVIDADSPEPEIALERKLRAEEVIGDAAGGVPFRVVVAVPELEILFFLRPSLLRRIFNNVDDHLMELAQLSPRRAIEKLTPNETYIQARLRILNAMDHEDVAALRKTDLIQDLLSFIEAAVEYSRLLAVSSI